MEETTATTVAAKSQKKASSCWKCTENLLWKGKWYQKGTVITLPSGEDPKHAKMQKVSAEEASAASKETKQVMPFDVLYESVRKKTIQGAK